MEYILKGATGFFFEYPAEISYLLHRPKKDEDQIIQSNLPVEWESIIQHIGEICLHDCHT